MEIQKEITTTSLGECIRKERLKLGLTQAKLGEMIGLKASRVSKIEKGAPITPEVASFILSKMGSKLELKVLPDKFDEKEAIFMISAIYNYATEKSISLDKSYKYLNTFKGLEFLRKFSEIERTLSYDEINSDLTRVCHNNGGGL